MVFVHHGRAFGEVFQFTKQRLRVALGAPAAAFRTRAFAEQLLFRNDRQARFRGMQSPGFRLHGDVERYAIAAELPPAFDSLGVEVVLAQLFQQHLAAPSGFRGNKHAPCKATDELGQFPRRVLRARVDTQRGREEGWRVHVWHRGG